MIKLTNILFENSDDQFPIEKYNFGPVYQGGTWDGKKPLRVGGRGALGSGGYFSPEKKYTERYKQESGGHIIEAYLDLKNPLEISMESGKFSHPCVQALIKLGMNEDKAYTLVERVEEQKGYLGTEISRLAMPKGYDGIFQYFDGVLKEVVVWRSDQARAVGIVS